MLVTKMLGYTITLAVCVGLLSFGVQAATFTVTNTNDTGAGSLREAVASANNNAGNDIILFDAGVFNTPQTINLQEEVSVGGNGNLEITGPGIDLLTITIVTQLPPLQPKYAFRVNASQFTLSKVKVWGVFIVTGASATIEQVSFTNLGFVNQGTSTVSNSLFNSCSSRGSGGAISNSGTMTLNRSTLSSNIAGNGGAVGNFGTLTINDSLIRDSFVTIGVNLGDGGGLYNSGGTATINNSLLTGNRTTDGDGGGIYVFSGMVNVVNSTISGNTAQGGANNGNGGGIHCLGFGGMSLTNVTVVSNLASQSNNNITSTGGFVSARNSLLADFRGPLMSQGYNLIADTTNTTISGTTTGNQLNVNPQIGSLANNGGITQTHALLSNSPAINAGNNALAIDMSSNPLRFDQRGACFRRILGGTVDIGAFEVQATANPSCNRTIDFYGDGTSDLALFRPENGDWHIRNTVGGTIQTIHFGFTGDIPQAADYDGDGRTDLGVYRPGTGTWFVRRSSDSNAIIAQFGAAEDKPVAGDYDGDGRAELAVFRPSTGVWWILNLVTSNVRAQQFGITEDKPVPQDFDGDGRTDIAVFRPSTGAWWIINSNDNTVRSIQWGVAEDKPVAGDYDADGRADLAVWRPSNGIWYILRSSNNTLLAVQWGASIDVPQPGDFDGDNRNDFIVWRASQTTWYILQSSNNAFTTSVFGNSTDIAASSPYRIE